MLSNTFLITSILYILSRSYPSLMGGSLDSLFSWPVTVVFIIGVDSHVNMGFCAVWCHQVASIVCRVACVGLGLTSSHFKVSGQFVMETVFPFAQLRVVKYAFWVRFYNVGLSNSKNQGCTFYYHEPKRSFISNPTLITGVVGDAFLIVIASHGLPNIFINWPVLGDEI